VSTQKPVDTQPVRVQFSLFWNKRQVNRIYYSPFIFTFISPYIYHFYEDPLEEDTL
jgi:hypothetical protein